EGKNIIKIEVIDSAGNKTARELTVTRTAATPQTGFSLSAEPTDKGISFSWGISGISVPSKGFRLIKGTSPNPGYSGKNSVAISASKRSYTWNIHDGKTYHFRICTFDGEKCVNYS